MTTFEYLAVLISIIVGLGITHLLGGIARFIHHPDRYKFFWIHLVWVWFVFLYMLAFWWAQLWMNRVEEWNSHLYAFLVLFSVLLYLLCVIITPPDSPNGLDLREYFFSKRKWFFGVFLATLFVNLLDGLIKDQTSTPMYFPFLLTLGALLTKNMKYHAAVALIFSVGLTVSLLLGGWDQWGVS